jgi:hypothetical protein
MAAEVRKDDLTNFSFRSVANAPATVGVANAVRTAAAAWCRLNYDWPWRNDHGACAEINAAVVSIAAAAAAGPAMPARAAPPRYRDGYSGLQLVKRCSRHGLDTGDAHEGDPEDQCKGRKPDHFFLLGWACFRRALESTLSGAAKPGIRLCMK